MVGFLQYLEAPFDAGVVTRRTKVRMGEPILVIQTDDVRGAHERALAAGATISAPPTDWSVPSHDGKSVIHLRSMSMFDLDGIYSEINQHL
jgi:hypothetical protein